MGRRDSLGCKSWGLFKHLVYVVRGISPFEHRLQQVFVQCLKCAQAGKAGFSALLRCS